MRIKYDAYQPILPQLFPAPTSLAEDCIELIMNRLTKLNGLVRDVRDSFLPPSGESAPRSSLKHRAIRTGALTFGGHGLSLVLRLGSNLVMTRLLVPEMFGVLALAFTFQTGLRMFSDTGINQNIIQSKRSEDPVFLNTAWSVQIIRGGIVTFAMMCVALIVFCLGQADILPEHSAYAYSALPLVLAAIGFTALFDGFRSMNWAMANRNMAIGRVTALELGSQAMAIITQITFALISPTVWALVAGSLLGSVLRSAFSHIVLPGPRNSWSWDRSALHDLIHFGKWIFLSSIFGFCALQADKLLLGAFLDANLFGLFSVAVIWVDGFRLPLEKYCNLVAYPALSERQRTAPESVMGLFTSLSNQLLLGTFAICLLLLIFSIFLVPIIYKSNFHNVGTIVPILATSLMFRAQARLLNSVSMTFHHLSRVALSSVVSAVSILVFMPIAFYSWGSGGAIFASALVPATSLLAFLPKPSPLTNLTINRSILLTLILAGLYLAIACGVLAWLVYSIGR